MKAYQNVTDGSFVPRLKHISKTKKELMISNEGERDGNKRSTKNMHVYQTSKGETVFVEQYLYT